MIYIWASCENVITYLALCLRSALCWPLLRITYPEPHLSFVGNEANVFVLTWRHTCCYWYCYFEQKKYFLWKFAKWGNRSDNSRYEKHVIYHTIVKYTLKYVPKTFWIIPTYSYIKKRIYPLMSYIQIFFIKTIEDHGFLKNG